LYIQNGSASPRGNDSCVLDAPLYGDYRLQRRIFLRAFFLAAAFGLATVGTASADPNVAGTWRANMESGVTITTWT
jgi:hypothetical protein